MSGPLTSRRRLLVGPPSWFPARPRLARLASPEELRGIEVTGPVDDYLERALAAPETTATLEIAPKRDSSFGP